jgi:hypothetical protein
MRALDTESILHLEKAALRDINAYKHLNRLSLSHANQLRKLNEPHEQ